MTTERGHLGDIGQLADPIHQPALTDLVEQPALTESVSEESPTPVAAQPSFATFRDFAVAVNRSERTALALARDGAPDGIPIDGGDVKKLMGTMWFRGVVPRLSAGWRQRVLDELVSTVPIPNHRLKVDHRAVRLSDLTYAQLSDVVKRTHLPDVARADVDLLMIVGRLWGGEALARFQFVTMSTDGERSTFESLLHGLRS